MSKELRFVGTVAGFREWLWRELVQWTKESKENEAAFQKWGNQNIPF